MSQQFWITQTHSLSLINSRLNTAGEARPRTAPSGGPHPRTATFLFSKVLCQSRELSK